ncbi:MAG: extracellular solute-binding protein [Candidatus Doudnabacteria bacterium]|nr:extracellular solute-binding protein [Candidatus Doudnabacteria bacterium]
MENKKYYIIGGAILFLIIILGAAFAFSGGPKKVANKEVELTWWKTFEDPENLSELIGDYQSAHKNVRIKYVKKDINDYEQELLNAIASGKGPDIFTIHNDWLAKHIEKMAPAPDKLIGQRAFMDTYVDVVSSDFVKDGRVYAIPLSIDTLALYYNKDILGSAGIAQPPKTWPQLIDDVQKITVQSKPGTFSKSGVAFGASSNVNRAVDILTLLMLQNGTKFYSDSLNMATFDQSIFDQGSTESFNPGAKALEFYTQFSDPAKKTYTWNAKTDFSVDSFAQGKLAMMLSYYYMKPTIENRSPNLNFAIAPVPQTTELGDKVNFANYWGEAVYKLSPNADEAWNFLAFLSGKESQKKYYSKHSLPSARRDIISEQISDENLGVFAESALTAKSVYKKDASLYEGIFLKMIDDVVLRSFRPEEAVRNAVAQVNLILQK